MSKIQFESKSQQFNNLHLIAIVAINMSKIQFESKSQQLNIYLLRGCLSCD